MNRSMRALLASGCMMLSAGMLSAETLRVAMGVDPVSLDPIATSDNASIWTQLLIYDTLIRPSKDGTDLEPGLAESWEVSEDGLTLTFKLREAKFSDGTPVTAEDVQFSLERAASEQSSWAGFFRPITGYEITGEHEIKLMLDKPFTPALNNLAMFSGAILPKKLVEAQGDAFFVDPVGSGPYALAEWTRGSQIALEENPHYWQEGKPFIENVELNIVTEGSARTIKLEAGEVDAIIDPPLNQIEKLRTKEGIVVGSAVPYRSDFVLLNTTKAPFDDEKVRRALNMAVDKKALIEGILYGAGKIAASAMPPMRYADESLEPYAYDLEKAKALLDEAGLGDGFEAELLVNSGMAAHRNVAVALQAMMQPLGVKLNIQMVEGGTHWETTKAGNYEMAVSFATSDTIDPDQLIGFLAVNPERANAYHTEWKSERLNELYQKERVTENGEARGEMFGEMVQLLHDGAPYIFLYHPASAWATRANVEGFEILPTSNFRLEDVKFAD
ncbi:MAG: ABC transporter substrate-binding protein [Roseovarius sp.]|nr:ABC transporter substrate-binding protein [Roseovarius sp.]